jgi:DNA-binding NarL/FixJ family response regulator
MGPLKPAPDAVLMDHRMPGMTGLVAARKILDADPSACIIMITGDSSLIAEARRAGVKAFLTKPLALKDLQQTVDGVLASEQGIPLRPALAGPRPTIEGSLSERDQDRRGRGASSSLVRENPA